MSFRTKHWSAIAVMAAFLLAVTGLSSPASALTNRVLSIGASPAYEYAGKPITFAGKVTNSPVGSVVKIQRKSGATWAAAGQTSTTTAAGAYSVKINAPGTAGAYTYRALAPKTTKLAGVYSSRTASVTVLKPTAATLTITPASVIVGASANFAGTVSPFVSGTVVTLQRQSGSSWVSAGQANLAANGSYTLNSAAPAVAGTYTYRVQVPLTGLNAGTVSPSKTLTTTNPEAPVITTTTLPDGDQNLPYTATLTKTGGAGTWSIPAGTLPGGLALNATTGVISGTPTGSGSRNLAVTFTETGSGLAAHKSVPITISPGPVITTATLPDATQGVAYSTTLAKTGRAGTWSITGLPAGLSIDATTGVISGTTTAAVGTYGVYPTFTETVGGRSILKPLALKVLAGQVTPPNGPVITNTSTLVNGYQTLSYQATLTKTGGTGTWSIPANNLPGGLSLNPATGVISGTPTGSGSRTLVVVFTETGTGLTATKNIGIIIYPLPRITTSALPDATQGVPYSFTLTAEDPALNPDGIPGGLVWTATGLPAGLSIDPFTGVISGTTTAAPGDYGVYPTVKEQTTSRSTTKPLALHINAAAGGNPTITTTSLPDATQGVAYSAAVSKSGQAGTWSATGLPAGLTLSTSTGAISGTTNAAVGDNAVAITFTETASTLTATKTLNLHVNAAPTGGEAPTITTTSLPNGDQYLAYTTTLTHTGGAGTWSVPAGSLPGGLSLNASTGVLSGTPTGSGTRTLSVTFKEASSGLSATKGLPITITAAPTITTSSLPDAIRGVAYTTTLAKTGGAGTWTIANLPTGLTIDAGTGVISGTTNAAVGDYGVYPTFTETSTGRSVQKALALHIGGTALAITTDANLPDGHRSLAYSVTFAKTGAAGTWSAVEVPDGLALNATTGVLSGTPTTAGTFAIYVTYTETASGASVTKIFALKVIAPKVTTTTIPTGVTGTAYSTQFAKTGLDGTWGIAGFLPDGINFTPAGLLSGTPTETGDFPLVITFTETSTGEFSKNGYVLHVEAPGSPTITTASLPNGVLNAPYSATLSATPTGGTWAITTGSLPVGLSLNSSTGAITGTPTVPERATFVVTYTKGATHNTKFFALTVPAP